MKNLHRLASVSLAACLAISLSACKSTPPVEESQTPPSAFSVYQTIEEQSKKNTALDADIKLDYTISMAGSSNATSITGNIKAENVLPVPSALSASLTMNVLGQAIPVNVYYRDKVMYVETAGQKVKQEMDLDKAFESFGLKQQETEESLSSMFEMKEENFSDAVLEEADGVKMLSFQLPSETFQSLISKSLESIAGDSDLTKTPSFEKMEAKISCNSEYQWLDASLVCSIKIPLEMPDLNNPSSTISSEIGVTFNLSMKNNQPENTMTITPPQDLNTYVESPSDEPLVPQA